MAARHPCDCGAEETEQADVTGRAFGAALLQVEAVELSAVSVSCARALLGCFGRGHPKVGARLLGKTGCPWQ